MSFEPIQTRVKLSFMPEGRVVTESLIPDLLSFTYEDKETNEADEISITLKDPTGKWANTWKPDAGEVVGASIVMGTVTTNTRNIYCGRFYVDSLRVSGSPRVFEMRAVSIPLNKPIRRRIRSKAWEKKTLKGIAETIAKAAAVKLVFDSAENPLYERQDQSKESDLKFLSRLCEEAGLSIKVTDESIVIFDQAVYEKKPAVMTLTLGESRILSWDFESQQSETYRSCTVTYRDPKQKKRGSAGGYDMDLQKTKPKTTNPAVMTYTYVDPNADENGQEYTLKKKAKSVDEAKRLAKAKLRQLNLRSVTGSMTVVGDVYLVAGAVVTCRGFGSFDGNFLIESASHSMTTSGYTTGITLRRVNNNY